MVKKLWRYVKPFYLIPERYGQTDRQTDRQTDLLYWRAIKTTKINGSVECRWCMTKSPSITVGRRSRAWSPDINTATVSPAINKIRSWVARFSRSRLWQMVLKNTQQFNTFSLTSPGGYRPVAWLTLLESCRRVDVKSWLTCNAVTYRFPDIRGKMAKLGVWQAKNGPPETLFDAAFGNP